MADTPVEMRMSSPRKRNHEGELVNPTLIPSIEDKEVVRPDHPGRTLPRHDSEAPSTVSSLTELTSTGINSPKLIQKMSSVADGSELAKKRKLTFAEREVDKAVRKREKDEREREKVEAKVRKDEEKRLKDEEKRRKEEEKEHTKRVKELEKAEKKKAEDAKKQEKEEKRKAIDEAKEAERLKKERSQLRIASFFSRPTAASTPPLTPDEQSSRASSRRSSIASIGAPEVEIPSTASKTSSPDFEKVFIPFFVHENTDVAPINRWMTARASKIFDNQGTGYKLGSKETDVEPLSVRFGRKRRLLAHPFAVKTIIESTQGSTAESLDFAREVDPLTTIPYKFLSFREDIRPPYIGTYTKAISSAVARKLSRRPTYRGRTDTNYDYDSEAEWEPPADDDEEIVDDELSDDEEGDAEMDDFLDDEGDLGRRRMFVGDMDPVSSGLCWQGESNRTNGFNTDEYRMDVLHDSTRFPIDPFSTVHWTDEERVIPAKTKAESTVKKEEVESSMPPPRLPLVSVSIPNTIPSLLSPFRKQDPSGGENASLSSGSNGRSVETNKAIKMVQLEYLSAFKLAVEGSDLTKAGLIEILKKQFPKCSKDAIKDTLGVIAVRVGKKEVEKRWQLIV